MKFNTMKKQVLNLALAAALVLTFTGCAALKAGVKSFTDTLNKAVETGGSLVTNTVDTVTTPIK